jgi:hypothetical protein
MAEAASYMPPSPTSKSITSLDCIFDPSLAARNLSTVHRFCNSDLGFGSGKLRPKPHSCFLPDHKHGSGTGDHWHGGKDLAVTALRPRWGDL